MKLRVPQYGAANKIVWVDDEATKGAVAGTNLYLSDGKTLVTDAMLTGAASSGTSATLTTTDDLNEGKYRLYFTNRRAQDAVGAIVGNSANVTLTYTGGTSLIADLTNVIVASGGTLKKRAFDAKGRLSQEAAATTDDLSEGTSNLYFTSARVLATTLTGLSTSTSSSVTASDSVLVGVGKLQAQVNANATAIAGKAPSAQKGLYASRPAASASAGVTYYATDVQEAYLSDGSTWTVLPTSGGELGYAEITTTTTTTSSTPIDIPGLSVTCLVGEKPVYIDAGGDMRNQISTGLGVVTIVADGSQVSRMIVTGGYIQNSRKTRVSGLTPGTTHTFKLQLSAPSGGTADLYGDASDKPYIRVSNT